MSDFDLTNPMNNETDWPLLARYLAGECTADEARAVEAWLAAEPERVREFEQLRVIWEGAAEHAHPALARRALARVALRAGVPLAAANGGATVRGHGAGRAARRPAWVAATLRVAAVAVIAAVPATFWWLRDGREGDVGRPAPAATEQATGRAGWRAGWSVPAPTEHETGRAQRMTIGLVDGSRATLAPQSRLRVPADFGENARVVELEGEAYFEVRRDTARPFVVRTERAATEVLGTSFLVRTDRVTGATEVVVVEGRVALQAAGGAVQVGKGEVGRLDRAGRLTVEGEADVVQRVAWTQGRLVFRRAPLPEVAEELERWFGVRVKIEDPALAASSVTATFENEPVEQVIETLARLLDARYERSGAVFQLMVEPRR